MIFPPDRRFAAAHRVPQAGWRVRVSIGLISAAMIG
jgi:hypothetical protein